MRLSAAIAFVLPAGLHKGQTLGWVAKHTPAGLSYLAGLYESPRLHDDLREALRSFLAAPAMQPALGRALGSRHNQAAYLLPSTLPGCPACGGPMTVTDHHDRCPHGIVRCGRVLRRCPCGIVDERILPYLRMHCPQCDDFPLFAWKIPT